MKMVHSTETAVNLLNEIITNADYFLGQDNDANMVAIETTKSIVNDPQTYRDHVMSQRNRAIQARSELGIFTIASSELAPPTA